MAGPGRVPTSRRRYASSLPRSVSGIGRESGGRTANRVHSDGRTEENRVRLRRSGGRDELFRWDEPIRLGSQVEWRSTREPNAAPCLTRTPWAARRRQWTVEYSIGLATNPRKAPKRGKRKGRKPLIRRIAPRTGRVHSQGVDSMGTTGWDERPEASPKEKSWLVADGVLLPRGAIREIHCFRPFPFPFCLDAGPSRDEAPVSASFPAESRCPLLTRAPTKCILLLNAVK